MSASDDPLQLSIAQRIDNICDQFENDWAAGRDPQIIDSLGSTGDAKRAGLFRALLKVEIELRQRDGKPRSAEEYAKEFPGYTEQITKVLEEVAEAENRRRRHTQTVSFKNASIDTSLLVGKQLAAPSKRSLKMLGRFEILNVLGEGAFGTVYLARDPQLDREVALKVPRSGVIETEEDVDRFIREAQVAATLRHSHICPIHDFGKIGDDYFIVMAYIAGKSLDAVLKMGREITPRKIANVVRKIAGALGEAHQQGVIHRDLKPANIMIDKKGEPVVMDFGLARRNTGDQAALTHDGAILGTPVYMPPEQARGDIEAIGPACDIYSLGVILYELLCGRRPFSGSVGEVLGKILYKQPPSPSAHKPDVDSQLEAICLKAMAKRPTDRYRSMADFAEALTDYLRARRAEGDGSAESSQEIALGSLIKAGKSSDSVLVRSSSARSAKSGFDPYHQWLGISPSEQPPHYYRLLGITIFEENTDVIGAAADRHMSYLHQIASGPHIAESQRLLNQLAAARVCLLNPEKKATYDAKLKAHLAKSGAVVVKNESASDASHRSKDFEDDFEDEFEDLPELPEWRRRGSSRESAFPWWQQRPVAIAAGVTATIVITVLAVMIILPKGDVVSQKDVVVEKGKEALSTGNQAEMALYTRNIALAHSDWKAGNVASARARLNACPREFRGWEYDYLDTLFNHSQKTLNGHADFVNSAAASGDEAAEVPRVKTRQKTRTLIGHTSDVRSVAFSPDGRRIVSGSDDSTIKVWDAETGREMHTLRGHAGVVFSVAFSPDGRRIASGSEDKTIKIWDAETGRETRTLEGHTDVVRSVAFSPDGRRIASGSMDKTIKLWDAETGLEMRTLKGRTVAFSVAFSPDGRRIVSASGTIKVWDAETGLEMLTLKGHGYGTLSVAFSPDGRWIVSSSYGQTIKVWDAKTGREVRMLKGHADSVHSVAFSPDGRRIVSGSDDDTIKVWDVKTGRETRTLKGNGHYYVHSVAFSPDGRRIVSGGSDTTVKVWDAGTGREIPDRQGQIDGANRGAASRKKKNALANSGQMLVDFRENPKVIRTYGNTNAGKISETKVFRFEYSSAAHEPGVPHCGYRVDTAAAKVDIDSVLVFRYRAQNLDDLRLGLTLSNQRLGHWLTLKPSKEWREMRIPLGKKYSAPIKDATFRSISFTTFAKHSRRGGVENGFLEIDGFALGRLENQLPAKLVTLRKSLEEREHNQENLDRFVRVAGVSTDRPRYKTGEPIVIQYFIVNTSPRALTIPWNRHYSHPMLLLGTEQKWIEPLSTKRRQADGGTIVPHSANVLSANAKIPRKHTLRRKLTPGRYRYLVEWKSTRGKTLNIESVEFEVIADGNNAGSSSGGRQVVVGKDDGKMELIYKSLKIDNARVIGGPFSVGDNVTVAYELKNTSKTPLQVPLDKSFSRPFNLVGTRQHWIKRQGNESTIPGIPPRIGRDGSKYAAGGTIIPSKTGIRPGKSLFFQQRVSTKGYPAGKYTYYIEYKKVRGGILQTVEVPFELRNK